MLFQPKHYPTLKALRDASIYAGNNNTASNEVINNTEIFGYFNGQPYEAIMSFCDISATHYWVAGEVILVKGTMPEWKKKEIAALNKAIKNNTVDAPDMPSYC